jgi:hypothetical protein
MVRRLMAVELDLIFLPTRGLDLLEAEEASVEAAVASVIVEAAEASVEDVDLVIVVVAVASVEVVASVIVEAAVALVEDVEAVVALTVQLLTKIKAISSLSRAKRPLSECDEPAC